MTYTTYYIIYLAVVTAILVIMLVKAGWRHAVTVALIVAKIWLAVYSVLGIDVPLLALYNRKTWDVIVTITFNEVQILTMALINAALNRQYILYILRRL